MNDMQMTPAHGDPFGWIVIVAGTLATLWTIGVTIYWIVRPGETAPDHPKRIVLREDR